MKDTAAPQKVQLSPALIERALSALIVQWLAKRMPNTDVETTRLRDLGGSPDEHGFQLSVGSVEFRVQVEQV